MSVFDTTLRDGEQTPGVSFSTADKIEIARQLSGIGVSVIEAGFPASSEDEYATVKAIVAEGLDAPVCGLARSVKGDVDRCIDAGVDMVHVFIPTSEVQRTHTIRKTHQEVVSITGDIVRYARDHVDQVLFSAMDATRTGLPELIEVFETAVGAGATAINVPDTVGVATPSSMKTMIAALRERIACTIDVHCHNDFGMATANTISAVEAGADQVQVTVNGIGERAGNADLACTTMIIESIFGYNTGIETARLVETSRMVSRFSGLMVPPNWPVTGEYAFSHESGIHSQGVLENASTFEPGIMTPEMVGHRRRLKLGKHVGRHAVRDMLNQVHISPDEDQIDEIIARIKLIASKGKKITEQDLYEIAETVAGSGVSGRYIDLVDIAIMTGNHMIPTATVRARVGGSEQVCCCTGNGPVDAAIKALVGTVPRHAELKEFNVTAISEGSDAIAHVALVVEDEKGRLFDAAASGDDIVMASAEAMTNALNMVYRNGSDNS
ncbi:MAG: 2-isopropylmalate synthase [Methanospirillum sp.]|uniref:2-isopropylmalate synthase n=1 Tax=Methanospirillum sp. TaxID=45200 RepID=UPI00236C53D2|nr:2-isopropylmalate synthase [Methanospirillum sp.]MDD1729662.1 2-isopropylmalate synthase [Methanospirillum sp.]